MKNRNLTNRVYHDVRNRILNFQLLPGAKVSDKDIAQQMGISRSPVRQALFRLAEQGLLQTRPNKGFVVKVYSPEELQDLFVFREAMEVKAIDLAVKKLTDRDIDRLNRQVDTYLVSIGKNDIWKLNQMDRAIHATL
ncbi:MAG: GntR family transcriptional regulator, partial [Desulfobacterales bacterium]|nr:GntR family transcriptional regulator [Desulfobacterales bacterium]